MNRWQARYAKQIKNNKQNNQEKQGDDFAELLQMLKEDSRDRTANWLRSSEK